MTKTTIVFFEIGLMGGIVLAALTVPRSTSLSTFMIISAAFVIVGNIFLVKKPHSTGVGEPAAKKKFWTGIYKVMAVCTIYWILWFLLQRFR